MIVKRVLELYQEGLTYKDIALELGMSRNKVFRAVKHNQTDGMKKIRLLNRNKEIIDLYRKGDSYNEMSLKLGISYAKIRRCIVNLASKGIVERHDYSVGREILHLAEKGELSIDEIAKQVDRSPETVRRILKKNGIIMVNPLGKTLSSTAKELKIPVDKLRRVIRDAGTNIGVRVRGNKCVLCFFSHEDIIELRKRIAERESKKCVVCGNNFETRHNGNKCCSDVCRKICRKTRSADYHRGLTESLSRMMPNEKNLKGWYLCLFKELETMRMRTRDNQETWATQKEAHEISGVSPIILKWARIKNILRTSADPDKISSRSGKPVILYKKSELLVLKEVFEKHKKGSLS